MKKAIYSICIVLIPMTHALAQQDITSFTATGSGLSTILSTDYECIGINPSNLGWDKDKTIHIGLLETGFSFYSDALTKTQLKENFLTPGYYDYLSQAQIQKDAVLFSNKGYSANFDVQLLGLSVQLPGIGGFGFSSRLRSSAYVHMNQSAADIIFNGAHSAYFDSTNNGNATGYTKHPQKLSSLMNGTKIYADVYLEHTLSYGIELFHNENIKVYGGIGIKYVQSFGILDIESKGGSFSAFTAFTPAFNVNYGAISSTLDTSGKLTPVGTGIGFDFGGSVIINDKIKVGLSVNDIGSIKYTGNAFAAGDQLLTSSTSSGLPNFIKFNYLIKGGEVFHYSGVQSKTISLPTNIRIGGSYEVVKNLVLGVDLYVPVADVPGNLANPAFALGGQIKLFKFFKLSSGMSIGGNSGFNIPLGFTFVPGKGSYEFGIATRDVLFFFQESSPNASVVFGFLRFAI